MTSPTIIGTAGGATTLQCSTTSSQLAWGTAGSPTMVVLINPSPDVTAYVFLGTGATVTASAAGLSGVIPVLPRNTVYLAVGANTNIAGVTASGGTLLTVIPST